MAAPTSGPAATARRRCRSAGRRPHPRPYEIALVRAFVEGRQAGVRDLPRPAADQRRLRRHALPGHPTQRPEALVHRDAGRLRPQLPPRGWSPAAGWPRCCQGRAAPDHQQRPPPGVKDLRPASRSSALPGRRHGRGHPLHRRPSWPPCSGTRIPRPARPGTLDDGPILRDFLDARTAARLQPPTP